MDVEGNLREYDAGNNNNGAHARFFPLSLLGGFSYEVQYRPGRSDLSFVPDTMAVEFKDGPGCGQGVTLRFRGNTGGECATVWFHKEQMRSFTGLSRSRMTH